MAENRTFKDYSEYLDDEIDQYSGSIKDYVRFLPAIFTTLTNTLEKLRLDAEDRKMILCVLGYLVMPNDLIPVEVYGPAGYIDDLFITSWALDILLRKYGKDSIAQFWDRHTVPVDECVSHGLEKAREDLGDLADRVLIFAGLKSEGDR